VAAAIAVTLHDEVLLREDRVRRADLWSLAKVSFLSAWFSVIASTTQVAALHVVESRRAGDEASAASLAFGSILPRLASPSSVSRRPREPALDEIVVGLHEEHLETSLRGDLHDPGAHETTADDDRRYGWACGSVKSRLLPKREPGRGGGSKCVPGGHGFRTVIVTLPYRTLPSGWISPSARGAGRRGLHFIARSNAASRVSVIGDEMLISSDALIGVLASSASAADDHAATSTRELASAASLFIDDQRVERMLLELVPSVQKRELDHECQPPRYVRRAAGINRRAAPMLPPVASRSSERQHALTGRNRVLVNGQRVAAVLELVLDLDRLSRQLAELADGNKAGVELMRERARRG
jgi:hypothetical protein